MSEPTAVCVLCEPPQSVPARDLDWHLWFVHDFTANLADVPVEDRTDS